MSDNGLRLTITVVRHSYGLHLQIRQLLSAFSGSNSYCVIAVCKYTFGYLLLPLTHCGRPSCKASRVAVWRQWGGALYEYHHHVVQACIFGLWLCFGCFTRDCIFAPPFLTFKWVVSFVCCKKHVLPVACIFSTDSLRRSTFTVAFFWGSFSHFCLSIIFRCCQRHVLPLACMFLDWIFRTVWVKAVSFGWANLGFEWYGLWYGERSLRGGEG